jgi:hypothetical protein
MNLWWENDPDYIWWLRRRADDTMGYVVQREMGEYRAYYIQPRHGVGTFIAAYSSLDEAKAAVLIEVRMS